MNLIEKITTIFSNKIKSNNNSDYILLSFINVCSIIITGTFTLIFLFSAKYSLAILLFPILILLFINLLFLKKTNNINLSSIFYSSIITILLLVLFFTNNISQQGILSYTLFPVIISFIRNSKKTNIFSIFFFLIILISFFIPKNTIFFLDYSTNTKLLFILLYISVSVATLIIKNLRDKFSTKCNLHISDITSKLESKEEFITKLSHQIRTPLNNLVVVTNIVNDTDLDEKQRDLIATIQASTNNLVNVVNNIKELANVDIHQRENDFQYFNLESTIKNTIKLFAEEDSINIYFPINISNEIDYMLYGDPIKLKQILLNLIETILKFAKSGKKIINIDISPRNDKSDNVNITFKISSDNLIHIPAIESLSEIDEQIKYIKILDLNIAKRIITSINGTTNIILQPGNFVFEFSSMYKKGVKITDSKTYEDEQAPLIINSNIVKIDLKDANILLVEDNLINQKIVLLSLKKTVKNIDIANNGKEALDKFGSAKYDVILMDIQMPIMNGFVTTKKIRNIEKSTSTHTPIIAITANALLGDKEECIASGMDDYLSKPFQIETLLNKMQNQLLK